MRKLFLPLLAAMALVGCSETDEPVNNGGGSMDYGYVAVNIVQPGKGAQKVGARAASEGFEYGTETENYAQEGLFFIFNADGTSMVGDAQRLALSGTDQTGNTPEVEKIYGAVLVIDGEESNPAENANLQIVCILNAPAGLETGVSTLSGLTDKIGAYDAHEKGTFIMTNSVYKNDETTVLGAVITKDDVKQSSSEAIASPVKIYVERVVAKVDVKTKDGFKYEAQTPTIDGVQKTLKINIKGLEIANIATTSYLFKNITGITYPWAWDTANKRSYWETCPSNLAYANQSYEAISPEDFDFSTATLTQYIQPNTSSQKTSVLVTAQLTEEKDGEQVPFSFIYLRGGYFTPENAGNLIASYLANTGHFWLKTGATETGVTYSQLPGSAFEWKNKNDFEGVTLTEKEATAINGMEDYEVIGRLKTAGDGSVDIADVYVKDGETYTPATATAVNEALLGYVAEYWNDGMCYYFMEIDQTPVANDNMPEGSSQAALGTYYGVVRNHIYKLTLSSIKGLGTPVFDPKDEIVPVRREDDELWYLAAEVEVLAWKIASQDVNFDM